MKTTSSGTGEGEYAQFNIPIQRDKPYNENNWRKITANVVVVTGIFCMLIDYLMIGSPLALYWGVGGATIYFLLAVWETVVRMRRGYQPK